MNFTNNRLTSLRICKLIGYLEKLIGRWSGCSGWSGLYDGQGSQGGLSELGKLNKLGKEGKLGEFYEFRNLDVLVGQGELGEIG